MDFFEVSFILRLGESEFPVVVTHSKDDFYITTPGGKTHRVERTTRCWKTDSRYIVMYINEIRNHYREIIQNFKWNLPENLRAVIYVARMETRPPGLTLWVQYDVDAMAFHNLLSRHLVSRHIKPVMPVQIYDARNSRLINLSLQLKGAKGQFPVVSPVTEAEIDKIFFRPVALKK